MRNNKFEELMLKRFAEKTVNITVEDILLELETSAEFNFDEEILSKIPTGIKINMEPWHLEALKMSYIEGAKFGFGKVIDRMMLSENETRMKTNK